MKVFLVEYPENSELYLQKIVIAKNIEEAKSFILEEDKDVIFVKLKPKEYTNECLIEEIDISKNGIIHSGYSYSS